jgi:hypothetical protein
LFSVVIDFTAASIHAALLNGGRDYTRAQRLSEEQRVARLGTDVRQDFLRMHHSSDGISELRFFIADAVAADHRASGLDHLRQSAGENALENRQIGLIRKTHEGERRERLPAHGVNVA